MALQVNKANTRVGIAAPQAYARVVAVNFDAIAGTATIAVNVYATKAARDAGASPIDGGVYEAKTPPLGEAFNPDAAGGLRFNAYTFLKGLPDFAGAQDV